MALDEVLLAIEAAAGTKSRLDLDASLCPFAYPYAVHKVGTLGKVLPVYWLEDLVFHETFEFAVVCFKYEFAVSPEVVFGE